MVLLTHLGALVIFLIVKIPLSAYSKGLSAFICGYFVSFSIDNQKSRKAYKSKLKFFLFMKN
ncbi:hypothetical protein NIES22_42440 [Calothrix brevissima NIES-22]|nr:hypothetical protein NIES22_42440 [Calothrix brevissima NIES-22]